MPTEKKIIDVTSVAHGIYTRETKKTYATDEDFRSSARPNGPLKTMLRNNVGESNQSNELFFVPHMRAKGSPC
jgi:hypothetical protein